MSPECSSVVRRPGTIVVHKLRHVFRLGEATQEKVMQHGIVQHHDARFAERQFVDAAMKLVIAYVIQQGGRALVANGHRAAASHGAEQGGRVVGHAGGRGRQRGKKPGPHAFGRRPNRAVPTRTIVAPSSIPTSRSCDMPIDSPRTSSREANCRNR